MPDEKSDHQCGAWGSLAEAREHWRAERQRLAARRRPPAPTASAACPSTAAYAGRPGSSAARARPAARRLPGRPAGEPRRSVSAAAWHSPGAGAAARGGLCSAGHLAARGARLARRPLDGLCALLEEAARRRHDALPLEAVVAQSAAMEAGELLALTRHLRTRLVPSEEPPAAAVVERIVQLAAAELRELVRRLQERLTAEG